MLRELWPKVRGMDKWPEVQATVRQIERYEMPVMAGMPYYRPPRSLADLTFAYVDPGGDHQYGSITVGEESSLYDSQENDTFTIRVNPKYGDQYFSPEAVKRPY
jgi:hypothetical protein